MLPGLYVARPPPEEFGESLRPEEFGDINAQQASRCERDVGFFGDQDVLTLRGLVEPVLDRRRFFVPMHTRCEFIGILRLTPCGSIQPGGQLRRGVTGHRRASDCEAGLSDSGRALLKISGCHGTTHPPA